MIKLEDGVVEMPQTRYYSQAKKDMEYLNKEYKDVKVGDAYIRIF
jgi:hypothetical protein